ncbi:23362_t:CDS:2 [Cetraspora pellucida]|uniref:23362_t:CDS:1 n=1 Tax=Cetraspora pellucida TaxID=1433469 RepID=A0A9N9EMP4_9GLOM|nr:23362_t:CDS:2 [Cetraspora pellucida]
MRQFEFNYGFIESNLINRKQNPDNIIRWCLNNQNNSIAQSVLASPRNLVVANVSLGSYIKYENSDE